MRFKRIMGNLITIGIRTARAPTKLNTLDKLQVLVEVASLVPHPAVKVFSRTATTGFLLYKQYQRFKVKNSLAK
ncbi:MAG: hypothetical protein K0S11_1168 [Gammaproteobacteria bacterium]|nr:hypothetical protein [Gammaproteobacteria bacterium]